MPTLHVEPADAQAHENLTVYPLTRPADPAPEAEVPGQAPQPTPAYQPLADALAAGTVTIGEVGSGVVGTLVAENRGEADVLILDGEQLVGAKQNRITSRSIILAAGSKTEIPVSCMEEGRWSFRSVGFRNPSKPRHAPSKVRRHARSVESASVAEAGPAALGMAQRAVWDEIGSLGADLGVDSSTGAMDDLYAFREADLERWQAGFPAIEGQVGIAAFLGDRPLGTDLLCTPELWARLHERILGGYLVDALADRGRTAGRPEAGVAVRRWLKRIEGTRRRTLPTAGRGSYAALVGDTVGGVLADRGRTVHLSAFPAGADAGRRGRPGPLVDPIAPPSRRRR